MCAEQTMTDSNGGADWLRTYEPTGAQTSVGRSRVNARAYLRYTRFIDWDVVPCPVAPVQCWRVLESRLARTITVYRVWNDMRCLETRTAGAPGPQGVWDCPLWTGPPLKHTPVAVRWVGSPSDRPDPVTIHRITRTVTITITGTKTQEVRCWRNGEGRWRWDLDITGPGVPPGTNTLPTHYQ